MQRTLTQLTKRLLLVALFFTGVALPPPIIGAAPDAFEFQANQAQHVVSGTVFSEEGEPLVGVTILVAGTTQGTVSDIDGNYSLDLEDSEATLIFSYTGYEPQEIEVNNRTTIDVTMQVGVAALEEVVVVGYGTQKKVNLTGAVSSIGSEALENRPITSVGQGLQGLVPNLNVSIRNGDPTQAANFNIRGYESINGALGVQPF